MRLLDLMLSIVVAFSHPCWSVNVLAKLRGTGEPEQVRSLAMAGGMRGVLGGIERVGVDVFCRKAR